MTQENSIKKIIEDIKTNKLGAVSSPSTNTEIMLDIVEASQTSRAVGQLVFFTQKEDGRDVLSLGQIVEVTTKNRWHEDMSFKGVIKRHGHLPNLSGTADNRVAKLSVQSSFVYGDEGSPDSHILGISPSTGGAVCKVRQDMIRELVSQYGEAITYIGRVYGTDIDLPMWFQHFGKDKKGVDGGQVASKGARDTYHIGVFGKTGSGKTVASAFMLLAYAKNKADMNILVLDPQSQFAFDDGDLLPDGEKLQDQIAQAGMKYESYKLVDDIALPEDNLDLLGRLLMSNGFVKQFDPFYSQGKEELMRDCIISYLSGRSNKNSFSITGANVLKDMIDAFEEEGPKNKYVKQVYGTGPTCARLADKIADIKENLDRYKAKWDDVLQLFSTENKTTIPALIEKIVSQHNKGNFIVLDMGAQRRQLENENMQAVFLDVIEKAIATQGSGLYADGERANCLIVMDEAHRYVNEKSADPSVRDLTKNIIDAVRTTRKYGIGHMFITQSLESLDDEIIKQMRVFAFGHGLTTGSELRRVGEIINNPAALSLYKSFIDPGINKKFPFMVFGPISPLSATNAPLFMEVYTKFADYQEKNKKEQNS